MNQGATDDSPDVVAAVLAYFHSHARREETSPYAWGPIVVRDRWRREAHSAWRFKDARVEVRRLDVVSVKEDRAEVDLEATIKYLASSPVSDWEPISDPILGPVTCRRVGGAWRVEDYVLSSGRSVARGTFTDCSGQVETEGVRVLSPTVVLTGYTVVYLVIENDGPDELTFRSALLQPSSFKRIRGSVGDGLLVVRAKERVKTFAAWKHPLPLDIGGFRMRIHGRGAFTGDHDLRWSVQLGRED